MKKSKLTLLAVLMGCVVFSGCGSNDTHIEIETESEEEIKEAATPTPTTAPTPTEAPLSEREFEATDDVNVRTSPSTEGDIIDVLSPGDKVMVMGIEDDLLMEQNTETQKVQKAKWYKIKLYPGTANETEGYVSTEYVKEVEDTKIRDSLDFETDTQATDTQEEDIKYAPRVG